MGDLLQPWHLLVICFLFFIPLVIFLVIFPFWFICKKAGFYPGYRC